MPTAIAFDFENRIDRNIELDEVAAALKDGAFCWVNLTGEYIQRKKEFIHLFGVADEDADIPGTIRFVSQKDCIQFTLVDSQMIDGRFHRSPVAIYFGQHFMLSVHEKPAEFISGTLKSCRENFRNIALSPGFLLFELADHLTQNYTGLVQELATKTQEIESELFNEDNDDRIFTIVAGVIRSILEFYKVIVSSREVLHDLATRLSPFIPETTQPYLEKKAALLDRLSVDVTTEREILSESLHLYMGIVTHRTNALLTRLTVVGTLFLPLTFIAGVYGMNFKVMPELDWKYGYLTFWIVAATTALGLTAYMQRKKWL
ncbi:MAG: magnesium transporter CorA family protein [Rhodopirellula sp.]|nr:magnesium transporter CorA family protein [Rhodopirellula sp.]